MTVVRGDDGVSRCPWGDHAELRAYHDHEWGREVRGERELFERLTLEAFQSGLSWLIIYRKRERFREVFAKFDAEAVAGFTEADVQRLLADPGIVRNRAKIIATVANAVAITALDGTLSDLLWSYAPTTPAQPAGPDDMVTISPESTALAKDLKRRGFAFVGPTTAYALMQATGMVNDHLPSCDTRSRVA